MDRRVRTVEKAAVSAMRKAGIEDYGFENGGKHKKFFFRHSGRVYTIPFSTSPRTSNSARLTIQSINRILRT